MIVAAGVAVVLTDVLVALGRHVWRSRPVGVQPPGEQWRFGWLPALGVFVPALAAAVLAAVAAWMFRRWRSRPLDATSQPGRFVVASVVGGVAVAGAGLAISVIVHGPGLGLQGHQRDFVQVLLVGVGISVVILAGWTLSRPNLRVNLTTGLAAAATIALAVGAPILARHAEPTHGPATTWNAVGGYWESRDIIRPDGALSYNAISCPTSTDCLAVGSGVDNTLDTITTSDGGASWTPVTGPPGSTQIASGLVPSAFLSGVVCLDQQHCIAADDQLLATSDGGHRWAPAAVPSGFFVSSVSCTTAGTCVAVGVDASLTPPSGLYVPPTAAVHFSVDGGATWSAGQLPAGPWRLATADCVSLTVCYAAGWDLARSSRAGVIFETATSGRTWTQIAFNGGLPALSKIVCPDENHCVALGDTGSRRVALTTLDGGKTWSAYPLDPAINLNGQIACVDDTRCLIADNIDGSIGIFSTDDGGQTWRNVTTLADLNVLYPGPALTCPNADTCILGATKGNGGRGIILSSDASGTSWQTEHTATP